MTTKEKILAILEENAGDYISGGQIAKSLEISRNAVWKAVKALLLEGYDIEASSNRGYRLSPHYDILSSAGITAYIDEDLKDFFTFDVRKNVTSTNSLIKEAAANGASEGLIITACHQTEGRGRLGRTFYSPDDTGLYFSLLLRPDMPIENSVFITTAAAVALCLAMRETFDVKPQIKWVNDLYLDDKKICGILTEASLDLNNQTLEHVVLGIGVNIYEPSEGFPKELSSIAGSLLKEKIPSARNRLLGRFLSHFIRFYKECDLDKIASLYRQLNFTVGKKITVISAGLERPAIATGIDKQCRLEIVYEDSGEQAILSSDEISIRHERVNK